MCNKHSLIKGDVYEITYLYVESNIWAPFCKIHMHALVLMYNTNTIIVHNIDVIADNIKYKFPSFLRDLKILHWNIFQINDLSIKQCKYV